MTWAAVTYIHLFAKVAITMSREGKEYPATKKEQILGYIVTVFVSILISFGIMFIRERHISSLFHSFTFGFTVFIIVCVCSLFGVYDAYEKEKKDFILSEIERAKKRIESGKNNNLM